MLNALYIMSCSMIHAILNRHESTSLIQRFKPQPIVIEESVSFVRTHEMESYIKARILLETNIDSFSIVNYDAHYINVFVCCDVNNTHIIESCIWGDTYNNNRYDTYDRVTSTSQSDDIAWRKNVFKNMCEWHAQKFPHKVLEAKSLDYMSMQAWVAQSN